MVYQWANPEQIGVVTFVERRVRYIDSGPEYEAAVAAGPLPFAPIQDPAPTPEEIAAILAAERAGMSCTPMQGQIALGETYWNIILAWRDTQATWAQKVIIDSAQTWVRNSQNIAFFAYLLNFTDEQTDEMFRVAMVIEA